MSIDISKLADMEGQSVCVAGLMPGMKFGDAGVLKIDEDNNIVVHNCHFSANAIVGVEAQRYGLLVRLRGDVMIYIQTDASIANELAPNPQCTSPND